MTVVFEVDGNAIDSKYRQHFRWKKEKGSDRTAIVLER
jgi:hypothetical protein